MLFNSLHFAAFFVVVWTLVALLRRHVQPRNAVLVIASYYFYAWWDYRFLTLLAATTLFDFFCGRMLDVPGHVPGNHINRNRRDKLFVAASMTLNLAFLGFFKYFNFFVDSAAVMLTHFGFQPHVPELRIILPIGISFYTFQSMNYVIDVYRGELDAEKSLLNFAVFVSFFPHLVAGPILRATALMPQIRNPNKIRWPNIYSGFYMMTWGLFKKVVIADNIAAMADDVFRSYPTLAAKLSSAGTLPGGGTALLGIYAFAIQIYCDFSGYTDMARGMSRMMGFELPRNFNLPYFAVNPSDFWSRWHISLSTWLRDYLYIPLGGNRKGKIRTYINLMITMLLGGLWHGAAWHFVLWGAYHGTLLCVHRAAKPFLEKWFTPRSVIGANVWFIARIIIFFQFVCFGWLLFRADSMFQTGLFLRAIGTSLRIDHLDRAFIATFIATAAILLFVQIAQARSKEPLVALRWPVPIRSLAYAAVILGVIIFGNTGGRAFIYFQF